MILTIGYERLSPAELREIAVRLGARVIDVRSRPSGRVKRGFSRAELTALLGNGYAWWGDILGGRGQGVTESGLASLASADAAGPPLLLLCQEHAPGDCHRHRAIAAPLTARGIPVVHLYENEAFTASALSRAMSDPDPDAAYDCVSFDAFAGGEMPPT